MKKIKLNLGCGIWLRSGWINVDNYFTLEDLKSKKGAFKNAKIDRGAEYVKADIIKMPFPDDYADVVEMHQVLEHIGMHRVIDVMKEVYRVTKPGGKLFVDVPSFTGLAIDWLQMVTSTDFDPKKYNDVAETIFGNQYADSEGELHRVPFTPQFMNYVLTNAGFNNGQMFIIPKGMVMPAIGELAKPLKGHVARNDILFVEASK